MIPATQRFRIVFMGTPDFAVPAFDAMLQTEDVIAVVTQPDRPQGRGRKLTPSPIKSRALQQNIPIYQPERLRRDSALIATLTTLAPDMIVVVAFGQILPEAVLNIPARGCINLHASLLPDYRGAAPIQWALIDGWQETGVTTMQMDAGVDTGPIFLQQSVPIEPCETADQLSPRLAVIGAALLTKTLMLLKMGKLAATPQATTLPQEPPRRIAPLLKKEAGEIRWEESATAIFNRWRGVFSWPGTTTLYGQVGWNVLALKIGRPEGRWGKPGEVLAVSDQGVEVAAGQGSIVITQILLAGKRPISPKEYQAGHVLTPGSFFASELSSEM